MNRDRSQKIISRFPRQRVLVVGDLILDLFVRGKATRISPEGPIPIVEVQHEDYYPGGSANVARNLRAMGAAVSVIGVLGADHAGHQLRTLLDEQGVDTAGLLVAPDRPTTFKTRVIAQRQQIVRYDRESTAPVEPATRHALLAAFRAALPGVDAVIFQDYAKGVMSQALLDAMTQLARAKVTTADPNARHPLQFRGLTAVTPNRSEAFAAAHQPLTEPREAVLHDAPLLATGKELLRKWQTKNLLITLSEHGMCLFRRGQKPHHIPTAAREVFDVSGAGDTVIATLTLALAAGANAVEAAEISNHAAGVVVGKLGTATCSPAELLASFER